MRKNKNMEYMNINESDIKIGDLLSDGQLGLIRERDRSASEGRYDDAFACQIALERLKQNEKNK